MGDRANNICILMFFYSISGVPMDVFIVREGIVVSYLQDAYFDQRLPVLPEELLVVQLTWQGRDDFVCILFVYKCILYISYIFFFFFFVCLFLFVCLHVFIPVLDY